MWSNYPNEIIEASSSFREKNDCTVKAFSIVFNTTYEKAHTFLKMCGRKDRKGIVSAKVIPKNLKKTKYVIGPYTNQNRVTLNKFCESHPRGRFYVCVRGHALAVINGVVHDYCHKPRRQVVWAMRVYLD